jgi:hypothetical protein
VKALKIHVSELPKCCKKCLFFRRLFTNRYGNEFSGIGCNVLGIFRDDIASRKNRLKECPLVIPKSGFINSCEKSGSCKEEFCDGCIGFDEWIPKNDEFLKYCPCNSKKLDGDYFVCYICSKKHPR